MFLSVALCTFNGELFIKKQLDSIIIQNLKVDEIIICDDASKDNTCLILAEYKFKYPELIKVINNQKSLGTIKNFEKAISLTKGELIFLSDQDDVWYPNKTEVMVSFFQENNDCRLLFTDGDLIDDNDVSLHSTLWDKWEFNENLRESWIDNIKSFKDLIINKNKITGATVCFHKSLKAYSIPINVPLGYWQDVWLGIHASALNGLFFIEQSLIKYRIHKNQQIGINSNVKKQIINNSNNGYIDKGIFYKNIKKLYPHKKHLVPNLENRNYIKKLANLFINKIK